MLECGQEDNCVKNNFSRCALLYRPGTEIRASQFLALICRYVGLDMGPTHLFNAQIARNVCIMTVSLSDSLISG